MPRTTNNTEQNCHPCTVVGITVFQCQIHVATTDEACLMIARIPYQYRNALRCELFELACKSDLRSADLLWRCACAQTIPNSTLASEVPCPYIERGGSRKLQPDHAPSPRYAERALDRDHHDIHIQQQTDRTHFLSMHLPENMSARTALQLQNSS